MLHNLNILNTVHFQLSVVSNLKSQNLLQKAVLLVKNAPLPKGFEFFFIKLMFSKVRICLFKVVASLYFADN